MNVLDPMEQKLRESLEIAPPPHLQGKIVKRLDGLRELDLKMRVRAKHAIALRVGGALGLFLALLAIVNGVTPRNLLGPVGRLLDAIDHWSISQHLPRQLLTVHAPSILAAILLLFVLVTRATVERRPQAQ